MATQTYNTVGQHTFSLPNASQILIRCYGGAGADGNDYSPGAGANGGFIEALVDVSELTGSDLEVFVGGAGATPSGGFNGGGNGRGSGGASTSGGGGGASDVRDGGTALADRIVVAGGGGGGGTTSANDGTGYDGGAGGTDTGESGANSTYGGGGGTQSAGGSGGGSGDDIDNATGADGSLGTGGNGANVSGAYGAGAGGGLYGGGGGGAHDTGIPNLYGGGGGGGSNGIDTAVASLQQTTRGANSGAGIVEIEWNDSTPTGVSATAASREITISWDDMGSGSEYTVYRSETPGVTPNSTQVGTTSSTSFTDTGLLDGATYYYAVTESSGSLESATSSEVSATTTIPIPTDLTVDSIDGRFVTLSWTDPSNNTDTMDILLDADSDGGFVVDGTVTGGAEGASHTYETTELLDGQQYDVSGETHTTDASAEWSATVQATTDLPDATGLLLDASISNQFTAEWDPVLNNGQYHIELRDDASDGTHPPYQDEATVGYDATAEHVISGLKDGEQYSVRIRSQTQYVTGDWLTAAEVTKLVAPTLDSLTPTTDSVDAAWTLNHATIDNGAIEIYRQREGYEFPHEHGELVTTLSDSATSYTDSPLPPEREFSYTIRVTTDWTYADSNTLTTETDSVGLAQYNVPPRGWRVVVEHPSGQTLTPRVLDDAERLPRLNAKSEVTIPVPRDERWTADALTNAILHVWEDGNKLPIDTLEDVETQPDRTVLHGSGGAQLDRRVRTDVSAIAAHSLAENLLTANTDYVVNVDEYDATAEDDDMQVVETVSEWEDVFETDESTGLSRWPATIDSQGRLAQQRSCWAVEGEDHTNTDGNSTIFGDDSDFSGGAAWGLRNAGEFIEVQFSNEYTIPAGEFNLRVRNKLAGSGPWPTVAVSLDGSEIISDAQVVGFPNWTNYGTFDVEIEPGTHTLRFEVTSGGDSPYTIDIIAACDGRFSYTWDETVHEPDGYLDGPELYPAVQAEMDPSISPLSVVAGELDVVMNDTSNEQSIGIRNVAGDNYLTASNATTVSHDFAEPGDRIQAQITLSGYEPNGPQDATPRYDYAGQLVESYTLTATLDDTPLIVNQAYDDSLDNILARIADDTNAVWEVFRDGGEMSIEWTWPGQRPTESSLDIADYTTRKVSPNIQKATIYGAAENIRDERFTADFGTAVSLENTDVIPGSEAVATVDGDVTYRRGDDYQISRQDGTITVLQDGNMTDGNEYSINYRHKIKGLFETANYSGDAAEEHVETIASLTSVQACSQAAKIVVDLGSEPRTEADVEFPPTIPSDLSLVETLDLEDVPGDAMAVYELQATPQGLSGRFGDRERVEQRIGQIESRTQSAIDRV